jgi:hypothetical protein
MTYILRSWGILTDELGLAPLPDDLGVDVSGNYVAFNILLGPANVYLNGEQQSLYVLSRVSDGHLFTGFFRLEPAP